MWLLTKAEAPLIGFLINVLTVSKPTGGPFLLSATYFLKLFSILISLIYFYSLLH